MALVAAIRIHAVELASTVAESAFIYVWPRKGRTVSQCCGPGEHYCLPIQVRLSSLLNRYPAGHRHRTPIGVFSHKRSQPPLSIAHDAVTVGVGSSIQSASKKLTQACSIVHRQKVVRVAATYRSVSRIEASVLATAISDLSVQLASDFPDAVVYKNPNVLPRTWECNLCHSSASYIQFCNSTVSGLRCIRGRIPNRYKCRLMTLKRQV